MPKQTIIIESKSQLSVKNGLLSIVRDGNGPVGGLGLSLSWGKTKEKNELKLPKVPSLIEFF